MNKTPKSTSDAVGGSMMRLVRRLLHRIAHLTGRNHGRVETWYAGRRLMVGFRCSCGKLTGIHPCQTETKLSSPNS